MSICQGVRRAELGSVPGFVGSAGDASDDQHADAIGPGEHPSAFRWPDPNRAVAPERKALARFEFEHAAALEREVHLFLTVRGVVVPGMAGGIRREIDRLHAEARQSELGPGL